MARVVVVGAGVSGLAAAHFLVREGGEAVEVRVVEAGERAGGKLHTVEVDGMPVEAGADSFVVRKPWAVELCGELGLEGEVVVPGATGAHVWLDGGLVPFPERAPFGVPARVRDLLAWPGLSRRGRWRALADLWRPARGPEGDEALGSLLRRRLGPEAASRMVEPLLGGLFAGDPARLSVRATFPELEAWERGHGSLLRGARAAARAAGEDPGRHRPMFATVWGGLDRLVRRLVDAVGVERVHLDSPVGAIEPSGDSFELDVAGERVPADAVVLATPAFEAARLLEPVNPGAAAELWEIPYASTAVVLLAYPPGTGPRLPEGTGFVVPAGERTITACTFLSRKWPTEAYGDRAVVRCFVGRAGEEEALALPDDRLAEAAAQEVELATGLPASGAVARVVRWPRSMPQYEVGHLERVARVEAALAATPSLFLTGSAYRGVGIADCVRQAREAARLVLARVAGEALGRDRRVGQEAS